MDQHIASPSHQVWMSVHQAASLVGIGSEVQAGAPSHADLRMSHARAFWRRFERVAGFRRVGGNFEISAIRVTFMAVRIGRINWKESGAMRLVNMAFTRMAFVLESAEPIRWWNMPNSTTIMMSASQSWKNSTLVRASWQTVELRLGNAKNIPLVEAIWSHQNKKLRNHCKHLAAMTDRKKMRWDLICVHRRSI